MRTNIVSGILLIVGALTVAYSSDSQAQQRCDATLQPDELVKIKTSDAKAASFHRACQQDFKEFNDEYGFDSSLQYYGIGGTGTYDQKNYEKWQSKSCSSASREEHQSTFFYYYQRALGKDRTEAYKACLIAQQALTCIPESKGTDIDFLIIWSDLNADEAIATNVVVRGAEQLGDPLIVGTIIKRGDKRVVLQPHSLNEPVKITLNVDFGSASTSCTGYVAAVQPDIKGDTPPPKLACTLSSYSTLTDDCAANYVYVGPHSVDKHGGACVSAGECHLVTMPIQKEGKGACMPGWVYAGPNAVEIHGGYCVRIKENEFSLRAAKVTQGADFAEGQRNCKLQHDQSWIYAGPNSVSKHWGTCLSLAGN